MTRTDLLISVRKAIATQQSIPTTKATAGIIQGRIQALQALEAALGPDSSLTWLDALSTPPSQPITDLVATPDSIAWAAQTESIFAEVPA